MMSFPDERSWRGAAAPAAFAFLCVMRSVPGIWKMDEPVGVGVWRKKDKSGNWISEKSEFDVDASKRRADHLDHFLKLPSFQQRYELEVKARDSVRDARKCAGAGGATRARSILYCTHDFGSVTYFLQTMQRRWRPGRGQQQIELWS